MSQPTKEIISSLKEIRLLLEKSQPSDWSALTPAEVIAILDREVNALENQKQPVNAIELASLFAPTAEIQEISMANGWHTQYLELSAQFDGVIKYFLPTK